MCGHSVRKRNHITWVRNIEDFASHLFHVLLIVVFITGIAHVCFPFVTLPDVLHC